MRIRNFGNTEIFGLDFAAGDRQAALRSMQRAKVRRAPAVSSGWGTDVAGKDQRSVQAWLNGKGDLRATWWNLYSRVYMALVPGADLERVMYTFHRLHHFVTLVWMSYVVSVSKTTGDIKQHGLLAAVRAAAADGFHGHG